MRHLLILFLGFGMALPAHAESTKARKARCAAQGEIVSQAVEMRKKRKSEATVKETILAEVEEAYAPSVPLLVGWVYTLNRRDLKADVTGDFTKQCNAFKP